MVKYVNWPYLAKKYGDYVYVYISFALFSPATTLNCCTESLHVTWIRKTEYNIPNPPPGQRVNLCRIPYLHARFRSIFPSFSISEYASKIRLPAHRFLYLRQTYVRTPAEFGLWFPYHSWAKQPAPERWFALYQLYIIRYFPYSAMRWFSLSNLLASLAFSLSSHGEVLDVMHLKIIFLGRWGAPGRYVSSNIPEAPHVVPSQWHFLIVQILVLTQALLVRSMNFHASNYFNPMVFFPKSIISDRYLSLLLTIKYPYMWLAEKYHAKSIAQI